MNTRNFRIRRIWLLPFLLLPLAPAFGCKTGKGCDCPTFGKNETHKVSRF